MDKQNDILDELRSWGSPLADMSRAMPFAVPEGYFSGLEVSIKISLQSGNADSLPLSKDNPYPVPEGYFETLPLQILSRVQEESKLNLPKTLPFEVPVGYFEQLPEQVLQAAKDSNRQRTKVIPLGLHIGKSVRWAAAAILVIAIGIGSYRAFSPSLNLTPSEELAQLPADVISEYVSQNIDEFDMEMLESTIEVNSYLPSVTEDKIDKYLDETSAGSTIN